jgi:hypothetical protein
LMEFLTALGHDVEIIVRPKGEEQMRGAIRVTAQPTTAQTSGPLAIK